MRKIVATTKAPAAIGPYAQANIIDNLVFTSGQIPLDPKTGELVQGGIEAQTRQVFANLSEVLKEAVSSLEDMVKNTCFLTDMNDFATVNGIYAEYFPKGIFPSRSAIEISKLPKGAMIEIEAIAVIK